MSLALVAQKLMAGVSARADDLATAKDLLSTAHSFASEKLGVFTLPTCACLAAKAALAMQQGDSGSAENDLNQCQLNIAGVLGDQRVELLQNVVALALTAIQDLRGNKLDNSCFEKLSAFEPDAELMAYLAKQFACQLFKAKVIFDQATLADNLSLVSSHLNSAGMVDSTIFECLVLLAVNDFNGAQKLLEEVIFELEESQAAKARLLLPTLILSYCCALQSKPESALTYVYWSADLAGDSYPADSTEYIELQLFAAYFAAAYDSQSMSEKYFKKITSCTTCEQAPAEYLLACFELQNLTGSSSFEFGPGKDQREIVSQAHKILFDQPLAEDFKWGADKQSSDSAQEVHDRLQSTKASYNTDLNPRLLLMIDRIQKESAAENLFAVATLCCST